MEPHDALILIRRLHAEDRYTSSISQSPVSGGTHIDNCISYSKENISGQVNEICSEGGEDIDDDSGRCLEVRC